MENVTLGAPATCNAVVVTIIVAPNNDLPVTIDLTFGIDEDTQLLEPGGMFGGVTDPDNPPSELTPIITVPPPFGIIVISPGGSIIYTPDPGFVGSVGFGFIITDPIGSSNPGTGTIVVEPVNDPPVAVDDAFTLDEDALYFAGGVGGNDTDPDGPTLTWSLGSGVSHGSLILNSDGSFNYTPAINYHGSDSFTYTVTDGSLSASASVTLTIIAVSDAPVAVDDAFATDEDTPVSGSLIGNDFDPDEDPLTLVTLQTSPTNGSLLFDPSGSITYTPNPNYHGEDTFTYSVTDSTSLQSNVATVTITVNSINDAPMAQDQSYTLDEDTSLQVQSASGLLFGASDPDGDPLSVTIIDQPVHGSLLYNPDGGFTYTPVANYFGSDSFFFGVTDGSLTATATASLTVNGVNDPPIADNSSHDILHDTVLTSWVSGYDPDGDPLTFGGEGAGSGAVTMNPDGSYTYTPNVGFLGTDTINFTVSDGTITGVASGTVSVSVYNTDPVASPDSDKTDKDRAINIAVLPNDTDIDGDDLTVSSIDASGTVGAVSINSNGTIGYDPTGRFNNLPEGDDATDTFSYTVSDGYGGIHSATVTVKVYNPDVDIDLTSGPGATDESIEDTTGALLAVNSNDNNNTKVSDLTEKNYVADDPDLVAISVKSQAVYAVGGQMRLNFGPSLKVYQTAKKTFPVQSGGGLSPTIHTYYVEGGDPGQEPMTLQGTRADGSVMCEDEIAFHVVKVSIGVVPDYLFAQAEYATPIQFTIEGVPENVNIATIGTRLLIDAAGPQFVPLRAWSTGSRFVAGSGPDQNNGSSTTYTEFAKSSNFRGFELPYTQVDPYAFNGFTNKAYFAQSVTFSTATYPSITAHSNYDGDGQIGQFADDRVPAIDFAGSVSAAGAKTFDFNINRAGGSGFAVIDDTVDPKTASEVPESFSDPNNSLSPLYAYFTEATATIGTGPLQATAKLVDAETFGGTKKVAALAASNQVGGYTHFSYGPRDASVLDAGELAMDLTKTTGKGYFDIFSGSSVAISLTNASADNTAARMAGLSSALGIGWALGGGALYSNPWTAAAFGIGSSVAALVSANWNEVIGDQDSLAWLQPYDERILPNGTSLGTSWFGPEYAATSGAPFSMTGEREVQVGDAMARYVGLLAQSTVESSSWYLTHMEAAASISLTAQSNPNALSKFIVKAWI